MSPKNEIAPFSLCLTSFLKIVPPSGHYSQQKNSPAFLFTQKNVKMRPSNVQPTISFDESCRNWPLFSSPVWTVIFRFPILWRCTTMMHIACIIWTDYAPIINPLTLVVNSTFLGNFAAPATIKGVTVAVEHVASTTATWIHTPKSAAVGVCATATIWQIWKDQNWKHKEKMSHLHYSKLEWS